MTGPHEGQPVLTAGTDLDRARAAVILIHGRGATARSILTLADDIDQPDTAFIAPQAANNTWYPNSFMEPVASNEPGRSSGLSVIEGLLDELEAASVQSDSVAIVGFSQGGCLASEFVARHPRRYGGLAALSGGLIGPAIDPSDYSGDLQSTPVFLGCSDVDPHIPADRVDDTARVFEQLNADVTKRFYPGMGHGINQDELDRVKRLVAALVE